MPNKTDNETDTVPGVLKTYFGHQSSRYHSLIKNNNILFHNLKNVEGTRQSALMRQVILSDRNICLIWWIRNKSHSHAKTVNLSEPKAIRYEYRSVDI